MSRKRTIAAAALLAVAVLLVAAWTVRLGARPYLALGDGGWSDVRCVLRAHAEPVTYEAGPVRIAADLYVAPEPTGSAVVLLHGSSPYGRRLPLMRVLAERLRARGYTVLAPDARAYGDSETPGELTADAFDFAADVPAAVEFLRSRGAIDGGPVFLVGHSFGGSVAVAAAAHDPGIAGVIAFGPSRRIRERFLDENAPDRAYFLERWRADMQLARPLDFAVWREVRDRIDIERHAAAFAAPSHVPLFLIDAEREDSADLAFLRRLRAGMAPDVEYWTVPGTGHYLHTGMILGRACYNARVMDAFVDRVDTWLRATS